MERTSSNIGNEIVPAGSAQRITRLEFVKQIGILIGVTLVGCSPIKILTKSYPSRFDEDRQLQNSIMRALVMTVIPGAPEDDPNLAKIYFDEYYPFHSYVGFICSDLCSTSKELFGTEDFCRLSSGERTQVIQQGLDGDETTKRLYRGAIFMAQVSFYGGIYDDEKGCALIDFGGENPGFLPEEMCYPDARFLLADEATKDGNYS